MKVLLTADAVGGVWTHALELARALGERVHVILAVLGPLPSEQQRYDARRLENVALHEVGGRLEWMDKPWRDVERTGAWLLDLAARSGPDVVHVNGYAHAALPWGRPVLLGAHSCVLTWWAAVRGGPAPAAWNRYRDSVKAGLAAADLVVTPSRAMRQALEAEYGPLPRASVIPNGRAATGFTRGPKMPLIFSAGRLWDEAKNVAALLGAAPGLPWPVCLAGHAGSSAERLGASDNVHYLGALSPEAMAQWLARASLFAAPAIYEPFGLSILEAALSACALLLGDIASLRETWDDRALFVEPRDHASLHQALATLITSPPLQRELGMRAYRRALVLTSERMGRAYLQAYRALRADPAAHIRAVACAS
jgi:glycogen(starch) synthase